MAGTGISPSERDISIYVRHKIDGHSLRRCGKEFGLHFGHILRICRAVQPWVVRQLVAEAPDRMTQKLEAHARYERIWQEANKGWRKSLKDAETLKLKGVATGDGQGVVTDTEKTSKGQAGDPAFLAQMNAALKGIRELWGLDEPIQHEHEHAVISPLERADRIQAALLAEAKARGIVFDAEFSAGRDGAGGECRCEAGIPPSSHATPEGIP